MTNSRADIVVNFTGIYEKICERKTCYVAEIRLACSYHEPELEQLKKLMKKLSHVKSLTVHTGKFKRLPEKFFRNQKDLVTLKIEGPSLIFLPGKIFANLKKLNVLIMRTASLKINAVNIRQWKLAKSLESISIRSNSLNSDVFDDDAAAATGCFSRGSKLIEFDSCSQPHNNLPAIIVYEINQKNKLLDEFLMKLVARGRPGYKLLQLTDCDFKADAFESLFSAKFQFEIVRIFRSNLDAIYQLEFDNQFLNLVNKFRNQYLRFLTIENCNLTSIPDFIGRLEHLLMLNLSNNKIKTLKMSSFRENRKLLFLNLARNRIREIEDHCDLNSHDLLVLDLGDNCLKKCFNWPSTTALKCAFLELKCNLFSQSELFEVFEHFSTPIRLADLLSRKKLIKKPGFFLQFANDDSFFATILENYQCLQENCLKIKNIMNSDEIILYYNRILNNGSTNGHEKTKVNIKDTPNDINAHYVAGYKDDRKFIISDGPKCTETVREFWQMIWQEKCSVIVMLLTDKELKGYQPYWPCNRNDSIVVDNWKIVADQIHKFPDHNIVDLQLTNEKTQKVRRIVHMQFGKWSIHGQLRTLQPLNQFVQKMNDEHEQLLATNRIDRGPIVVHCCRRNTRSAMFCTIDICLNRFRNYEEVNVYWVLDKIYRQKPAIQMHFETFRLCYASILEEAVQCDVFNREQLEHLMTD